MSSKKSVPEEIRKPAPWTLKGVGYAFFVKADDEDRKQHPTEYATVFSGADLQDLRSQLSEGDYSRLPRFNGNIGCFMVFRYSDSAVGPYDEILYVPGNYDLSGHTASGSALGCVSVTRIYVSTVASLLNGRRNWGVPKHVAQFEWKTEGPWQRLRVIVPSPSNTGGSVCFFAASFRTVTPTVPATLALFGASWLCQLYQLDIGGLLKKGADLTKSSEIQTRSFLQTRCSGTFWGGACEATIDQLTNTDYFPPVERMKTLRYGIYMPQFDFVLNVPVTAAAGSAGSWFPNVSKLLNVPVTALEMVGLLPVAQRVYNQVSSSVSYYAWVPFPSSKPIRAK